MFRSLESETVRRFGQARHDTYITNYEFFVERMRAAQRHGLLRDDLPPAHLLLILINVITQWFEARKSFIGWSELDESTADAVFLETLECVFLDGARSRTGESVAVSQNERAVKGAGSHVL